MGWQPKQLTREQLEERRLEGGRLLLDSDWSQAQIAAHLGVSKAAVCKWKQQLDGHNNDRASLVSRRAPGSTGKLSEKQWQQLLKLLSHGAIKTAGFQTDNWTLSRIQQLILRRFDLRLSTVQIRHHLHRHGWSPQKPQPQASQRDDELVEAWLRQDWPRIKKSLAHQRSHHPGR